MDSSTPIFSTKNRLYESCRTTGCRILFLFVVLLLPNTLRAATYYVDATGGNVDQRLNGGRFNVLCTVPALTAGSTLTVDIDNESGGYVIADAVRVIKQ